MLLELLLTIPHIIQDAVLLVLTVPLSPTAIVAEQVGVILKEVPPCAVLVPSFYLSVYGMRIQHFLR